MFQPSNFKYNKNKKQKLKQKLKQTLLYDWDSFQYSFQQTSSFLKFPVKTSCEKI